MSDARPEPQKVKENRGSLLTLSALIVFAIAASIITWLFFKPGAPADFGDCVARALQDKTHESKEKSLNFGNKISKALNPNFAISDKEMSDFVVQQLSDQNRAAIIEGCLAQYHEFKHPYMAMVTVQMAKSGTVVAHAEVSNPADFARCTTGGDGKCPLLIVRQSGAVTYSLRATCADDCRPQFKAATAEITATQLEKGAGLAISVAPEESLVEFVVLKHAKGVSKVKVRPNYAGEMESQLCHISKIPPADCKFEFTDDEGIARFYFPARDGIIECEVDLTLPDGTHNRVRAVVPEHSQRYELNMVDTAGPKSLIAVPPEVDPDMVPLPQVPQHRNHQKGAQ